MGTRTKLLTSILVLSSVISEVNAASDTSVEERILRQEETISKLQERVSQLESEITTKQESPVFTEEVDQSSIDDADSSTDRLMAAKEKTEVLDKKEMEAKTFPGSWPMYGTDTRMKIGGYIKTDFVIDFDGTLDENQFLMSTIPVEGTPEYGNDGYTSFFAKETRINFDMRKVRSDSITLQAFLEGDFFTDNDRFRLRHAYINVGDFVLGQTWTTLSFLESLPYVIDFAAGDALFGGRTTQIRYTHSMSDAWKVSVALEELAFLGMDNPYNLPGEAKREFPLLALRSDYRWNTGVLFLGTSVTQLHWDGGQTGPSDDALQYAFIMAGRQKVTDADYVSWNVSYGEGSGENILAFAGSNANAVLNADGKLETMPAFSLLLGGGHEWNTQWSSHFSYAYGWLDTPDVREDFALKRGGIGHINLLWKPLKDFSTGVEYMWGAQRTQNDAYGKARRLQFMARFDF